MTLRDLTEAEIIQGVNDKLDGVKFHPINDGAIEVSNQADSLYAVTYTNGDGSHRFVIASFQRSGVLIGCTSPNHRWVFLGDNVAGLTEIK